MQGYIIPFGYAAGGVSALERLMEDERAYLVDIRLSPRSRWQAFNKQALQARWRSRYLHLPELGNVHYNNGHPIKIANPDQGIARLVNGLSQGYTIVLMCGCVEYESCHRRTVVHLVQEVMPQARVEMPEVKPRERRRP